MRKNTDATMERPTEVCPPYQQLRRELTLALQLCEEYDSPIVCPINTREVSPERAMDLREAAELNLVHAQARVFVHKATCLLCMLRPDPATY
jgi:hypothetical protein